MSNRRCITNSPDCSGLNPCTECHTFMMVKVLPPAMRAAGFAGKKEQAGLFFKAYADAWKKMLSEPLPKPQDVAPPGPPGPPPPPVEQAPAVDRAQASAVAEVVVEGAPPGEVNGKTKLKRGDVKRMAEQEAEVLAGSTNKPE